jgi:PII-like signaling protein
MELPHEAVLLRIFTSTDDRWGAGPLYLAIVERARELRMAGATVLRGPLGFGRSRQIHRGRLLPVTQDVPVVIEIVDTEDHINSFLPVLDEMMESGLVTLERAQVLQYGRHRMGFFARMRQQLFGAAHSESAVAHDTDRN